LIIFYPVYFFQSDHLHHSFSRYSGKKTTDNVSGLCRQYFSSFTATALQYLASVFCTHPFTETMYFFPFARIWLKCSLHLSYTSLRNSNITLHNFKGSLRYYNENQFHLSTFHRLKSESSFCGKFLSTFVFCFWLLM